jgi:hypothetical protein
MLIKRIAALAAVTAAVALATAAPVVADGLPAASKPAKTVKYSPRTHVAYTYVRGPWPGGPDPYAYSYERPGYYPYYNSNMWVPRKQMLGRSKYPLRIPEYYSSWGYPLACKVHGRRSCGVPFRSPAGEPRHYYRRDVQLHQRTSHN